MKKHPSAAMLYVAAPISLLLLSILCFAMATSRLGAVLSALIALGWFTFLLHYMSERTWHQVGVPAAPNVSAPVSRVPVWRRRFVMCLAWAVPILMPPLFYRLYQPINEKWTVKWLGCGCPPIDGRFRFNANYFNMILWLLVFAVCVTLWVWLLERTLRYWQPHWRGFCGGIGIAILLISSVRLYFKGCWL